MLDYADFYRIADYANMRWKGGFAPIEIAENAYNYLCEFQSSKEKTEKIQRMFATGQAKSEKNWD